MICQSKKCGKDFNPNKQPIKFKVTKGKVIQCPHCGLKYTIVRQILGYTKLKTGQVVRVDKKVRMSKKQRLKLRRSNER